VGWYMLDLYVHGMENYKFYLISCLLSVYYFVCLLLHLFLFCSFTEWEKWDLTTFLHTIFDGVLIYHLVYRAWCWFGCEPKHVAHVMYVFMQCTIVLCLTVFYLFLIESLMLLMVIIAVYWQNRKTQNNLWVKTLLERHSSGTCNNCCV
jgi:hypothetical protein